MKKQIKMLMIVGAVMCLGVGNVMAKDDWTGSLKAKMLQEDSSILNQVQTTLIQAIETAGKEVPGQATKARLEKEDGYFVYSIEIVGADGKEHEVLIDPVTGKVLETE